MREGSSCVQAPRRQLTASRTLGLQPVCAGGSISSGASLLAACRWTRSCSSLCVLLHVRLSFAYSDPDDPLRRALTAEVLDPARVPWRGPCGPRYRRTLRCRTRTPRRHWHWPVPAALERGLCVGLLIFAIGIGPSVVRGAPRRGGTEFSPVSYLLTVDSQPR